MSWTHNKNSRMHHVISLRLHVNMKRIVYTILWDSDTQKILVNNLNYARYISLIYCCNVENIESNIIKF